MEMDRNKAICHAEDPLFFTVWFSQTGVSFVFLDRIVISIVLVGVKEVTFR
jgi:hypothetical protein